MPSLTYPVAPPQDVQEILHGVPVADPYRWLEEGAHPEVRAWEHAQTALARGVLDAIPLRQPLAEGLERLWRYDDFGAPVPCLRSERIFYVVRRAAEDKWSVWRKDRPDAPAQLVLDPNTWDAASSLEYWVPSPDGRYVAYGRARAGDEATRIVILDVDRGVELEDTLGGWRQGGIAWLHDGSGLYFSAKPVPGAVPAGEHHYWHRVWFHRLGTTAEADRVVFGDDDVKEHYHGVQVSPDGRWLVLYRVAFERQRVWVQDLSAPWAPRPLMDDMVARYDVHVLGDRIVVCTDWGAPRRRVLVADVDRPEREAWRELIPESERDTLVDVAAIDGRLYLTWLREAASRIEAWDLDGRLLGEIALPGLGTASVWGRWQRPEVWVSYNSFDTPPSIYTWDEAARVLTLYRSMPIALDTSPIRVERRWYTSRDGTRVSMFVARRVDAPLDGDAPTLLYGYGGFGLPRQPTWSTMFALFVLAGGVVALPNLRGGGEYGREWHAAGARHRKQNVFDDAIAAAEDLIAAGLTRPERLAAMGGSNGGLLVGALATQRPDLFRVIVCQMPLLDMVRYHRFGLANIWSQEFGSADDPEMFPHLLAYSPYHNVREGVRWPAMLFTAGVNDARTDPLHARKLAARIQATRPERPVLLLVREDSGHHGAVTLAERAAHAADELAFLMSELGMRLPAAFTGEGAG